MESSGHTNKLDGGYTPSMFLRCHSRIKTDAADKTTDVWHCAFEPVKRGYALDNRTSAIFATCGGNSVCVINAEDATVKTKHYSKDTKEDFHALAWTTLITNRGEFKILAVAGSRCVLHLLDPDRHVCFVEHNMLRNSQTGLKTRKCDSVESLLFHPEKPNILFAAFQSGTVDIYDIGAPCPPEYKCNVKTLKTMFTKNSACALTFSVHCDILLCATNAGAVGWTIPETALEMSENFKQRTFHFPANHENLPPRDRNIVDSIEAIGDGKLIATKCALHGSIYIWDLKESLKKNRTVRPIHTLKWSPTDNFYMNMGINSEADTLACGDDKGNLWVYNVQKILQQSSQEHNCENMLKWPKVEDSHAEKRKKLPFGNYDIVVNKVAFSYDSKYLVAVTNTNTVCIWKRDD